LTIDPTTATEPPTLDETPEARKDTTYVVLVLDEKDGGWHVSGRNEASNGETACRAAHKAMSNEHGVYLPVPLRSWHPIKIGTKIEQSTTVEPFEA